jgi:hypothetical protein
MPGGTFRTKPARIIDREKKEPGRLLPTHARLQSFRALQCPTIARPCRSYPRVAVGVEEGAEQALAATFLDLCQCQLMRNMRGGEIQRPWRALALPARTDFTPPRPPPAGTPQSIVSWAKTAEGAQMEATMVASLSMPIRRRRLGIEAREVALGRDTTTRLGTASDPH